MTSFPARIALIAAFFGVASFLHADDSSKPLDGITFFENDVLPILKANCFRCHDGENIKGGLRLGSRAGLLVGGDSGPAFDQRDPSASLLLEAINYQSFEMPPKGKLASAQIASITRWVEMGAPYPQNMLEAGHGTEHGGPPPVNEETMKWWSFQKVQRPVVPRVEDQSVAGNPIDAFIQHRRQQHALAANPEADKLALMRRAYYDLTGLPPTPAQAKAFLANQSPSAYEDLIDQLLDSPHYGEKWARHWLDVVRYAESNSYERDGTKPYVWRYRDYVIRAFNDDKPYDQFIIEQLAGDELAEDTNDSIIATGYYRLGLWQDEPVDAVESLYNDLDDLLVTTGEAFLGLTIGCARCHDHKIDPIPQRDYYSMLSFFRNVRRYGIRSRDSVLAASVREIDEPGEDGELEKRLDEWKTKQERVRKLIAIVEDRVYADLTEVEKEDFQYEMNKVPLVKLRIDKLQLKTGVFTLNQFRKYEAGKELLRDLEENRPLGLASALCVKEHGREAPPTYVLARGNAHAEGEEVQPAFLSVLAPPEPQVVAPPEGVKSTGRRLALARWIASRDNPLTARVLVNRIWQHHFGRGIVRSTSDYGFQGSPPTHPKLLDWLAAEFMDGGWSVKRMHKLMMMSATYRMSSRANPDALAKDADNDFFWRFNMRRLLAEEIRDSVLAVNGSLNLRDMFGPSVYPVVPAEVLHGLSRPGANWLTSKTPEELNRRTIYVHVKRSLPLPMMASFDAADPDKSCPVRFVTVQPTQALGMLNSDFLNQQAEVFANSLKQHAGGSVTDQVRLALWRTTQRPPTAGDVQRGVQFVQSLKQEDGASDDDALRYFCLLALNLNEFMYLD